MKKLMTVLLVVGSFIAGVSYGNVNSAAKIKYSADKMIHNEKTHTLELIGNAKVTLGDEIVNAEKITLNLKTGPANAAEVASFTSDKMTVELLKSAASQ